MGTITKNFSYSEFEASAVADSHHIINVITDFRVRDAVYSLTTTVLQPFRDARGTPVYLNSGYRCKELNKLVGGADDSPHEKGEAADVRTDNPLGDASLIIGLKLPFDQLIIYPTFIHVSHKLNGPQRGQILYNHRWKGARPW